MICIAMRSGGHFSTYNPKGGSHNPAIYPLVEVEQLRSKPQTTNPGFVEPL